MGGSWSYGCLRRAGHEALSTLRERMYVRVDAHASLGSFRPAFCLRGLAPPFSFANGILSGHSRSLMLFSRPSITVNSIRCPLPKAQRAAFLFKGAPCLFMMQHWWPVARIEPAQKK